MNKFALCLVLMVSCNLIAMDRRWKQLPYDADDEMPLYNKYHSKKSTCSKMLACGKAAAPYLFYTASLLIVAGGAYYAGTQLKESCKECAERLDDASEIVMLAKNCTVMVEYAIGKCPDAIQACASAIERCWDGRN